MVVLKVFSLYQLCAQLKHSVNIYNTISFPPSLCIGPESGSETSRKPDLVVQLCYDCDATSALNLP